MFLSSSMVKGKFYQNYNKCNYINFSQISSILHKPSYVPGRSGDAGRWENCLATHFDVAVIRCLFVAKWSEEGIFWAITYLHRR